MVSVIWISQLQRIHRYSSITVPLYCMSSQPMNHIVYLISNDVSNLACPTYVYTSTYYLQLYLSLMSKDHVSNAITMAWPTLLNKCYLFNSKKIWEKKTYDNNFRLLASFIKMLHLNLRNYNAFIKDNKVPENYREKKMTSRQTNAIKKLKEMLVITAYAVTSNISKLGRVRDGTWYVDWRLGTQSSTSGTGYWVLDTVACGGLTWLME